MVPPCRLKRPASPVHRGGVVKRHSCSFEIVMPNSLALVSLEPAPGPATKKSVLLETEPDTFAPSFSALFSQCHRLGTGKNTVFPETSEY